VSDAVREYYEEHADREWRRLENDRVEFALTVRAFREHLPAAPASVLDIGGGPGRYAIHLARLGYDVTLADVSEAELRMAGLRAAEAALKLGAITFADARDLSIFNDDCFDAVVMLGPLYHLLDEGDRDAAVREAARVLKPGGVLIAAFITRYAILRFWAKYEPDRVSSDWERYEEHIRTGQARDNFGFTDVYLARPEECAPWMEQRGFETRDLIGAEGVVSMIREKLGEMQGPDWERWMDLNYRLGKDPSTHGITEHLLYVGRLL
jgi:SAM-dependent methyltransferase